MTQEYLCAPLPNDNCQNLCFPLKVIIADGKQFYLISGIHLYIHLLWVS